MNKAEWDTVYPKLRASFPNTPLMGDSVTRETWWGYFRQFDLTNFIEGVAYLARSAERPTVEALLAACEQIRSERQVPADVPRLAAPPPVPTYSLAEMEARFERMDPTVRNAIMAKAPERWPGLWARLAEPQCLSMIKVLVVTTARIDPDTGLIDHRQTYEAMWAEHQERAEQSLVDAMAQLEHEQSCTRCRIYSEPCPTQDHIGEPCDVGKIYYAPLYTLYGNRWNTPKSQVRRRKVA
jgi:hypothetical protein